MNGARAVVERRADQSGSRVGAGVKVIDRAHVETDVTEGFLPAAVEIHFDVAARKAGALAYVGVPVAEVDTAGMAVIEAALDRRFAVRLVDAAEPVLRGEGDVSGHRRGRRGCLLCLRADRRRGCGREREWNNQLTHVMLSLRVERNCRSTVSTSCATQLLASRQRLAAPRAACCAIVVRARYAHARARCAW